MDLFPGLDREESADVLLKQNTVLDVDLRLKEREVNVYVASRCYLSLSLLAKMERKIAAEFDLRRVHIHPRYEGALMEKIEFQDVAVLLSGFYPLAPAVMAGSSWKVEGTTLHAHLRGNGISDLRPHLHHAEAWLSDCFGTEVRLELHGGPELSAEELFAETKRLRERAMEQTPTAAQQLLPAQTPKVQLQPQPRPRPQMPELLYGKPFAVDPIPMSELNLDMFKVCVEGEVFSVNHKELSKAKAWVVKFYMTDHTGSVCVSQYLEQVKAKPLLEAIYGPNPKKQKPGIYIRVLGKVILDRYDNELVLQPLSIKEVPRPVRRECL